MTKEKWSFKTGDILKEVEFYDSTRKGISFKYRLLLNRGDRIDRLDCIMVIDSKHTNDSYLDRLFGTIICIFVTCILF